ncbi:unnamed protein product [Gulo gulo]|uniref:Uncharacterized protein n=1 Tax=Gulo gulo TaxID=48420 RepID=A0A9X9LW79_GULGU|nr:unnamed protein product [Gulo gulo]
MAHRPLDPGWQQEVAPPNCAMSWGRWGKELDPGGHHHPFPAGARSDTTGPAVLRTWKKKLRKRTLSNRLGPHVPTPASSVGHHRRWPGQDSAGGPGTAGQAPSLKATQTAAQPWVKTQARLQPRLTQGRRGLVQSLGWSCANLILTLSQGN